MNKEIDISELLQKLHTYLPDDSINLVKRAFEFAKKAHTGQKRESGDDYISHPVQVALILANLGQDASAISAGLLHDVLEDCDVQPEQIRQMFGDDIYHLVKGVTKLGTITVASKETTQIENFRKLFLAMAKDLRVIIIKLADRLHNMRTLKYLSSEQQKKISQETRDIFCPLAHRLGMSSIKWELEDLSFYFLEPADFQSIKRMVASRRREREHYLNNFIYRIKPMVDEVCKFAKIYGRPKHFYSIYRKMKKQNCSFDELYDVLGVRVLMNNVKECYEFLGSIHSAFKPVPERIKDYIAVPKSNMYQSLHTTVIGPDGKFVELQIRTYEMDRIAEYGIAAHWMYKEGQNIKKIKGDFSWLRQIVDAQKDVKSWDEYIQNLRLDLFEDEVFVFTPKGDVHILAKGATPLDFAYKIHTEVGHRCVGAKANGEIVNLDYKLKNGDQISILTAKKLQPKLHWLNIVVTHQAKTKIKQWFRKQKSEETIQKGREILEKLMLNSGFLPKEVYEEKKLQGFFEKYKFKKIDELFSQIGLGEITAQAVIKYLKDIYSSIDEKTFVGINNLDLGSKKNKKSDSGVLVLGQTGVAVNFANCCHPLPGDAVVGFITKGYGVTIHRIKCKNITNLSEENKMRLVEVSWDIQNKNDYFLARIVVEAFDRIGILKEVVSKVTETKTNISSIESRVIQKGSHILIELEIEIKNFEHLEYLIKSIRNIDDVFNVIRKI